MHEPMMALEGLLWYPLMSGELISSQGLDLWLIAIIFTLSFSARALHGTYQSQLVYDYACFQKAMSHAIQYIWSYNFLSRYQCIRGQARQSWFHLHPHPRSFHCQLVLAILKKRKASLSSQRRPFWLLLILNWISKRKHWCWFSFCVLSFS